MLSVVFIFHVNHVSVKRSHFMVFYFLWVASWKSRYSALPRAYTHLPALSVSLPNTLVSELSSVRLQVTYFRRRLSPRLSISSTDNGESLACCFSVIGFSFPFFSFPVLRMNFLIIDSISILVDPSIRYLYSPPLFYLRSLNRGVEDLDKWCWVGSPMEHYFNGEIDECLAYGFIHELDSPSLSCLICKPSWLSVTTPAGSCSGYP
jgi:hypothetical protein